MNDTASLDSAWYELPEESSDIPELTVDGKRIEPFAVDWRFDEEKLVQDQKPEDVSEIPLFTTDKASLLFELSIGDRPVDLEISITNALLADAPEKPADKELTPLEDGTLTLSETSAAFTILLEHQGPQVMVVYASYYAVAKASTDRFTNSVTWIIGVNQPEQS